MAVPKIISLLLAGVASITVGLGVGVPAQASPPAHPGPATASASRPAGGGLLGRSVGQYYELRNDGSNKCADVTGQSRSPGAIVHQCSCANDDNQLWLPQPLNNGYYWLVNRNSGLCLDIRTNLVVSNGTLLQQYPCFLTISSEQWRFNSVGFPSTAYQISSAANTGKCIDLAAQPTSDGAKIQMWDCFAATPGRAQSWRLTQPRATPSRGGADGAARRPAGSPCPPRSGPARPRW